MRVNLKLIELNCIGILDEANAKVEVNKLLVVILLIININIINIEV